MIYTVPSFNSQRNKIGKPANILDEFRKRKKENKSQKYQSQIEDRYVILKINLFKMVRCISKVLKR